MKDALGHGSASSGVGSLGHSGIQMPVNYQRGMQPAPRNDTARTVANLRARMQATNGASHMTVLAQGIRNFIGGS